MVFNYVLYISVPIYAFGFIWFFLNGYYSLTNEAVWLHMYSSLLFLLSFLFAGFVFTLPFWKFGKRRSTTIRLTPKSVRLFTKLTTLAGWFATFFVALYLLQNGFVKILAIGSDLSGADFRHIGWNHHNKLVQMPMELSRRALLPFVILAKLALRHYYGAGSKFQLFTMIIIFTLASIINLDRGPVFVWVVLFSFYFLNVTKSNRKKALLMLYTIPVMALAGWLFHTLQYNLLDFSLKSFSDSLFPILINRILLSPVIMGQTWVFDYNYDPVYLEYARLGVLWGQDYIGTTDSYSHFVAPVGIIGDIHNNFGLQGQVWFGFLVGLIAMLIQSMIRGLSPETKIPLNFVALILAIYLIHGGLFSMGPSALAIFLLVTSLSSQLLFSRRRVVP